MQDAGVKAQTGQRSPTDAELVRRVCDGDRGSFDLLIERHQRQATAVAYRLLSNTHDALEVCQEAFVRAYRGLETLDDPERFTAWLLRIVTNLALNFRRSRKHRAAEQSLDDCLHDDDAPIARLEDGGSDAGAPGAALAAGELRDALQAALGELPQQQRTALVLFSMEQLPQKDVAEIMGCSVEAVKWHVFQARRKLKERLADYLT